MTRGNRTNHPLKFARDEDLKELKERFVFFIDNDFRHLIKRVNFQDVKLNFLLGFLALVLALLGIIIVKVI